MNYLPQLTFTRFVAALLIVVLHYGQKAMPFEEAYFACLISEGAIAVSYFFFLSGFVLSINYLPKPDFNTRLFWLKRFARLYPVYLLAFAASLLTALLVLGSKPRGFSILLQALGLHAWYPEIALEINYPAWSLSVELFFYLLFPFFVFWFRKISFGKMALLTLVCWLLSGIGHIYLTDYLAANRTETLSQFVDCFPLWHLNVFLFGLLGGACYLRWKDKGWRHWPILAAIGSMLLSWYLLCQNQFIIDYNHNGLMAPLFFLIVLGLALDRSWLSRLLGHPVLVFLGNISYSVYILQFPVYLWFIQLAGEEVSGTMDFYAYLGCLLLISGLSYQYIERPARRAIVAWKQS